MKLNDENEMKNKKKKIEEKVNKNKIINKIATTFNNGNDNNLTSLTKFQVKLQSF